MTSRSIRLSLTGVISVSDRQQGNASSRDDDAGIEDPGGVNDKEIRLAFDLGHGLPEQVELELWFSLIESPRARGRL